MKIMAYVIGRLLDEIMERLGVDVLGGAHLVREIFTGTQAPDAGPWTLDAGATHPPRRPQAWGTAHGARRCQAVERGNGDPHAAPGRELRARARSRLAGEGRLHLTEAWRRGTRGQTAEASTSPSCPGRRYAASADRLVSIPSPSVGGLPS
jgi:hypothetical protein